MKRLISLKNKSCEDCEYGEFNSPNDFMYGSDENEFNCMFEWDELPDEKQVELKLCGENIEDIMEKAFNGQAINCPGFSDKFNEIVKKKKLNQKRIGEDHI